MPPLAKLHKSAVKVVHAFWLCVCQNSPHYPSSPFSLFRGALMPTHKKRKEAEKHFLLDLRHNSKVTYAVQISYCWMCTNGLPQQPQYFLKRCHLLLLSMDTSRDKKWWEVRPSRVCWKLCSYFSRYRGERDELVTVLLPFWSKCCFFYLQCLVETEATNGCSWETMMGSPVLRTFT